MTTPTKYCPRCKQALPITEFYPNAARRDGLTGYCGRCHNGLNGERKRRLRAQVLEALGGKCQECGYNADDRALQVDHKNGDGATARKFLHGEAILRKILNGAVDDFQLLCANCNWIKMWEQKERGARVYKRTAPDPALINRANRRWTPEQRQKQAEKSKALWQDAEFRGKQSRDRSERMKKRWASGEVPTRKREEPP